MELDRFINALGKPGEWSQVPSETVSAEVTSETPQDTDVRKIIGSAATKQEVDHALDSLEQN